MTTSTRRLGKRWWSSPEFDDIWTYSKMCSSYNKQYTTSDKVRQPEWHSDCKNVFQRFSYGTHIQIWSFRSLISCPLKANDNWTETYKCFCRPTNYKLLRWLVEMPSRDFEHYRMTDNSRSRSRDNWKMSRGRLTCQKMSGGHLTCEKCQETRGHEFDSRPITKSNVIFCTLFFFTFSFVFLFIFLRFS